MSEAILKEFEADWCECGQDCHVAARLIAGRLMEAQAERDRLQAEIDRMRNGDAHMADGMTTQDKQLLGALAEIDALKAELAILRQLKGAVLSAGEEHDDWYSYGEAIAEAVEGLRSDLEGSK